MSYPTNRRRGRRVAVGALAALLSIPALPVGTASADVARVDCANNPLNSGVCVAKAITACIEHGGEPHWGSGGYHGQIVSCWF